MIDCPSCGAQVAEGVPYCPVCGSPRPTAASAAAAPAASAGPLAHAVPDGRSPEGPTTGAAAPVAPVVVVPGSDARRTPAEPVAGATTEPERLGRTRTAVDPWSFPGAAATPSAPAPQGLVTGVPWFSGGGSPSPAPAPAPNPAPAAGPVEATPAVAPVAPPVPAAAPEEEGWDETRLSVREPATRHTAAPARPVALGLPDGTSFVVSGPTLVGRAPQSADSSWALLAVTDPKRSVSKTHVQLDVDAGGLWVTDRGSTNGTVISEPGRPPRVVAPGTRARVPLGAALHLGELRLSVQEARA